MNASIESGADEVQSAFLGRALARDPPQSTPTVPGVEVVAGDLTSPDTLIAAVDGVDAIEFTHGSDGGGKARAE